MRNYVFKKKWKAFLALLFDFLGGFLISFKRHSIPPISSVRKILVTRIDHLGDALMLRPVLKKLHEAHPSLEIHILTTPENMPVFEMDSFLKRIILFPGHWFQKSANLWTQFKSFFKVLQQIKIEKYDAAIDFRGDVRTATLFFLARIPIRMGYGVTGGGWMLTHERIPDPALHQVRQNLAMLSDWLPSEILLKNPPVTYQAKIYTQLKEKIINVKYPYAVVHMNAGNPLKEWPEDHFASLMKKLLESNIVKNIFIIGTEESKKSVIGSNENIRDLCGKTNLHELACLLDGCSFFIGNDSGPAHLAAAQGIPVVVLSSSTNNIQVWHPWTKNLCILSAAQGETVSVERAEAGIYSMMTRG